MPVYAAPVLTNGISNLFHQFIFVPCCCKVTRDTYTFINCVYFLNFSRTYRWEDFVPGTFLEGGEDGSMAEGSTVIALMVFFSYVIVLNTVVPISLYVR